MNRVSAAIRLGEIAGEQHGDVVATVEEAALDAGALVLEQLQLQFRVPLRQALQVVGEEIAHHGIAGGDLQGAFDPGVRLRAVERVVDAALDRIGVVEEVPAAVGQVHALGRAGEQGDAEHALQFLDRAGHRRLRDVQVDGGLGYLAELGGGDEVANLAEGQGHGEHPEEVSVFQKPVYRIINLPNTFSGFYRGSIQQQDR